MKDFVKNNIRAAILSSSWAPRLLAFLFSLFTVLGQRDLSSNVLLAASAAGWYLVYRILWELLRALFSRISLYNPSSASESALTSARVFAGSLCICFVLWLPYFLTYYPGILSDDSFDQLKQVLGLLPYSNHHPWLHTLLIGLLYRIGTAIGGNPNAGVAFFIIIQMLVMSAIYAYLITTLHRHHVRKFFLLLSLLFYALFPLQALYSITMWKDILFSGVFLLMSTLLWQLGTEKPTKLRYISYVLTGILLCLFRSNGFYTYLFCLPFFVWLFNRIRKPLLLASCLTLAAVWLFKGPVMSVCHVSEPDAVESLSIPLQQISGTIASQGLSCLTEEESALLGQAIDLNRIAEEYYSHISDPIKNLIRYSGDQDFLLHHKLDFLQLYLRLGLRYPKEYLLAYINQTYGYWYPDVSYWVFIAELPDNALALCQSSRLPEGVTLFIGKFCSAYEAIPIYRLFWRIGTYIWIMLICFAAVIHKKSRALIPAFLPSIGLWLSLLVATPVYAEFRYAYPIVVTAPLLIALAGTPTDRIKTA